jgi:hypothetical protein
MEKKIKIERIFGTIDSSEPIKVTQEMIDNIQVGDYIVSEHDEGHESENNSWDAHWKFEIHRERLETDEEYQKRIEDLAQHEKWNKERRYKSYLKLKQEFE